MDDTSSSGNAGQICFTRCRIMSSPIRRPINARIAASSATIPSTTSLSSSFPFGPDSAATAADMSARRSVPGPGRCTSASIGCTMRVRSSALVSKASNPSGPNHPSRCSCNRCSTSSAFATTAPTSDACPGFSPRSPCAPACCDISRSTARASSRSETARSVNASYSAIYSRGPRTIGSTPLSATPRHGING